MLEPTLAHLGKFLAKQLDIPNHSVVYTDRELLYHHLSKNSLPITLPGVAYSMSEIVDPMIQRPIKMVGDYNLNFTSAKKIQLIPVNLSINISMLSSNLNDFLYLSKAWFALVTNREFTVVVKSTESNVQNDIIEGQFNCQLNNHSSLSTPSGGKEGRDFDRGMYYVSEGSFEVNTYIAFSKDHVVIRNIRLKTDLGETKIIGG